MFRLLVFILWLYTSEGSHANWAQPIHTHTFIHAETFESGLNLVLKYVAQCISLQFKWFSLYMPFMTIAFATAAFYLVLILSSTSKMLFGYFCVHFFFLSFSLFTSIHGYANSAHWNIVLVHQTKTYIKHFTFRRTFFSRFLIFPLALCAYTFIYRLLHSLRVLCILNRNLCNRLHCIKSCV